MKELDALDLRLIQLLGKDARQSSEALAKQLNMSSGTVRRRLRQLMNSGVLRIAALVDPDEVGLPFAAFMALGVDHLRINSAMQRLTSLPEVRWAAEVTGMFDIIVFVRLPSGVKLAEFIDKRLTKIDGLKNIETFVCIRTEKIRYVQV